MVDLVGLLQGAFSNKSILELEFKFAIDSQFQDSIDRDIHYSTVFETISGLVVYERLTIPKSTSGHYYCGSISKVYVFSLNNLSTCLLSPLLLKKIIVTVSETFKRVHNLGYVFNDLKPGNIYMDSNGDIDIGDFGGVTEIGQAFLEITEEYIPGGFGFFTYIHTVS
jgi:serine/threonine protein kinase